VVLDILPTEPDCSSMPPIFSAAFIELVAMQLSSKSHLVLLNNTD
jgi:hypothetical protein